MTLLEKGANQGGRGICVRAQHAHIYPFSPFVSRLFSGLINSSLVEYPNEEDLYGALFKGEVDGIAPACMITNAYYNSAADRVDFLQVERRVIFEQLSWVGI